MEARLRFLQDEAAAKQERLGQAAQEGEHAQAMLRRQQATMAEGEQTLQRMRTVELPALRDELRREAARAAAAEAKLGAVEQQLGATSQALRESLTRTTAVCGTRPPAQCSAALSSGALTVCGASVGSTATRRGL